MKYYVVETHVYTDYPDEVTVLFGPFDTVDEAEKAWADYAEDFREYEDVEIDDDWHRVDIDDGQNGRRTIMIAKQVVKQ